MKLSLGSWAFATGSFAADPWPFVKVLEYASRAQYDGIEISGFRPYPHPDDFDTPQKCRELLKVIKGRGLGISGYAPDLTQVPPAEVPTADYLHEFHKCLDFCTSCGIEILRVDTVNPSNIRHGAAYARRRTLLVDTWKAAGRAARSAGVSVVWEFAPIFWLHETAEVERVMDAVANEGFKVLFNTRYAYTGAPSVARHDRPPETLTNSRAELILLLREYIGHLYLGDPDGPLSGSKTEASAPFGEGKMNLRAVLLPIRQVADGLPWWCVDLGNRADAEGAGRTAVRILRQLMAENT
jgi:sugar phosphate isomerase/epimerase